MIRRVCALEGYGADEYSPDNGPEIFPLAQYLDRYSWVKQKPVYGIRITEVHLYQFFR